MRTLDLGEAVGPGVPTGGTANQVLVKNGATNFDTSWKDASQLPAIGDEAAAREAADAALADGLAIIANGDTHAAVAAGQAVFVRSHSTLAPGLYWASSAIGTNAALSTSNLTPDSQGGLNKLKGDIDSLNSKITSINDLLAYLGHTYVNNNESFTITLNSQKRTFLFYRSYQPNILYIDNTGSVSVVAGQNQSITVTASNNVLTITNTIGWGMGFFWLII